MATRRLVGLIAVPLDVSGFAGIAAAFDDAYPGCTAGQSHTVDVPLAGGARYMATMVPIFAVIAETTRPEEPR